MVTMQEARGRIRLAAVALAFFLAMLTVLHILNWNALPRHVSSFVRLQGSWLWNMGLLALAAALAILGFALPGLASPHKDARLACRLLVAGSATTLILFLFPTDVTPQPSTWVGGLHDVAAATTILLVGSAMFLLVDAGRHDASWARVAGTSLVWPSIVMGLGYAWGLGDLTAWWPIAAVFQRALCVAMTGWLIVVAARASSGSAPDALSTATPAAQRRD